MTEVESLVRSFGQGSNTFLTLYEGFEYLSEQTQESETVVPYFPNRWAWVGACEPLAPKLSRVTALQGFREAARKNRRAAVVLPVNHEFSLEASTVGWGRIQIGMEPIFDLDQYYPQENRFHSAKHLKASGAKVRGLSLHQLTEKERKICESMVQEWFDMRGMAPLSFLNRVNPWEQGEHKRYFLLENRGSILGFLAAVPIWSTRGWYFVDLIRWSHSPPGTTELLILEAMKILKQEKAAWVSLGVSPMAGMENAPISERPYLYRMLELIFKYSNGLYRFKSLYEFKCKFEPTRIEPAFLIHQDRSVGVRELLGLLHAFVPGGIFSVAASSLSRFVQRFKLEPKIQDSLRPSFLSRPLPMGIIPLATQLPLTVVQLLISVALIAQSAVSQPNLDSQSARILIDLLVLPILLGLVEGSVGTLACFLLAIWSSLSASLIATPWFLHQWQAWISSSGGSSTYTPLAFFAAIRMMTFSTLGAAIYLVRRNHLFIFLAAYLVILGYLRVGGLIPLIAIAAMAFGAFISRLRMN